MTAITHPDDNAHGRTCPFCGLTDIPGYADTCPACGRPLDSPSGVLSVPPLGPNPSAVLIKWLVPDGARVEADQPLCELETENANADLPSPRAGTLHHVKREGDVVRPGDEIARII
jgi:Biotin-requiring enzyme